MRVVLVLGFILFCVFGCEKSVQIDSSLFDLTMQKQIKGGPCRLFSLTVNTAGKVTAEKYCTYYVECEDQESNVVTNEKRQCPKHESEKIEKQLSSNDFQEIIAETEKTNLFSYKDNYSAESGNCSSYSTDSPVVTLRIKTNKKEKEIEYDYGCYVKSWFRDENNLTPLINLENKIIQTCGIENWVKRSK